MKTNQTIIEKIDYNIYFSAKLLNFFLMSQCRFTQKKLLETDDFLKMHNIAIVATLEILLSRMSIKIESSYFLLCYMRQCKSANICYPIFFFCSSYKKRDTIL